MKLGFALLPFLSFAAHAQDAPSLPLELFGIALGSVYALPAADADEHAVGTFPIKRLVSEPLSVHRGNSLYFEPLSESAAFPYREFEDENNHTPMTSFRTFVYPILPEDVATLADLQELDLPQKVFMIEWSLKDDRMTDGDRYTWAADLCGSFEDELGLDPDVTDIAERDRYRCVFSDGERELEVSSAIGQTIQLSYDDEITDRMNAEVYGRIRRLELLERFNRRR
jgi:hypothetical protein